MRHISWLGGDVDVYHHADQQSASYGNLMTCGNSWVCPFCAARKSEERRKLLQRVVEAAAGQGLIAVLTTYTLSHKRGEKLAGLWAKMSDALRRLRSGRAYQRIKQQYGIVGSATGREVTYGDNGWHPHIHELLFVRAECLTGDARIDLRQVLAERWLNSLAKVDASASLEHGFDLRLNAAPEYVSKYGREDLRTRIQRESGGWTESHEVTKGHIKISRSKTGRTAFQLLRDYTDGDMQAGLLFKEYAATMHGRTQFKLSSGLLELLDIDPDEAAPLDGDGPAQRELLMQIPPGYWRAICALKKRYQVLCVASAGDAELVQAYVSEVVKEYDRKIEARIHDRRTVFGTLRRNVVQSGESGTQASPESRPEGRTRTGSPARAAAHTGRSAPPAP